MTPRDFIAHFDTIAEAPNGIARLREFVLRLAVRGRLVSQDSKDESATILLERIAAKRIRLVQNRKLSKPKVLPEITRNEIPAKVPKGWEVVRFGEIFLEVFTGPFGTSLKKSEYIRDGTPVINPQNLRSGRIVPSPETAVGPTTLKRLSGFRVARNDLVVARRGEMGRCAVVGTVEAGWLCGTGSMVLRPSEGIYPPFVAMFLRNPSTVDRLSGDSVGSTMKNLNQRIMLNLAFALPPTAEQHRIVTKADELMGLLDQLEEARHRREAIRTASRDSAFAALRSDGTADEIKAAWMRIAARMDDLFMIPADVSPLREIVLQLAIRGRLTPQREDDEPVTTLLDRIAEEKGRLVKKKMIHKPKHLPPIEDGEAPFPAPNGWTWCRLGSILRYCRNGISASPDDSGIGYPILRISAATSRQDAVVNLDDYRFADVPPEKAEPYLIEADDLLACRFNGNLHFVGRVAIVPDAIDRKIIHPDKLIKLQAIEISPQYLCYAMNAESTRKQIHEVAATTAGNIGINGRQLQNLIIPIPPLAEQYRIVSKVEELIRLTDRLEYHSVAKQIVHDAFSITAVHRLESWPD